MTDQTMTDDKRLAGQGSFFGRRKGKALRPHQADLFGTLLPRLTVDPARPCDLAGLFPRALDGYVLEIGFGGGEHLAHQAQLHPGVALTGAEAFLNGVAKLLAEIEERGLRNVRVHYGDARALLEALPDQSMERIYLLYPDPWPKERQKKRRFVSPAALGHFHRVLTDDGLFLFASDIPDYVNWTRDHVAAHGGFAEVGDPSQPFADWTRTRYETKAIREGRTPAYLTFRKR